jgi:hypothetical protein
LKFKFVDVFIESRFGILYMYDTYRFVSTYLGFSIDSKYKIIIVKSIVRIVLFINYTLHVHFGIFGLKFIDLSIQNKYVFLYMYTAYTKFI